MHTHHHDYPTVHMPQVPPRRLLENQTAIVTGASSGIGKAIAIALGAAGANVCVNFVTGPDKAEDVVAEIEKDGGHAFAQQADVSSEADVLKMFEAVRNEFGSVDILINNAGLQSDAPFVEMTRAQWQKVIDVNLTGQFLCAREAVREFRRQGVRPEISCAAGKIICISSVHEVIPWGGHVNYAASKGGGDADDEKHRPGSRALAYSRQLDRAWRDSHADQYGGVVIHQSTTQNF